MKVLSINNITTPKQINNVPAPKLNNYKQAEKSALELSSAYNIAFSGLFKKEPDYKYDASLMTYATQMEPNTPYLVAEDTKFQLGSFNVDLSAPEEKYLIDSLKPNSELVLGRKATILYGMNNEVSREHLKIKKTKDKRLIATDLGSTNGTKILPNIETPNTNNTAFCLVAGKKYLLPKNSILNIGGYNTSLKTYEDKISKLKEKEAFTLTLGDKETVELTKYRDGVIAKNKNHIVNAYFVGLSDSPLKYVDDYSQILGVSILRKNTPTLIPQDAQIRLSKDLTIDTKDKRITNLLDAKGRIVIGRSSECDIVVDSFNDHVSNKHIAIDKTSDGLVVTDLNATNSTMIVPRHLVKPFYNGLERLELKQGNIGDCTLLASLYSLSLNPKGRRILENMVSMDTNGNYVVQFNNSRPITVSIDELHGEKNKKGDKKYSVEGDFGIKAIERAYARFIKNPFTITPTMFATIDDGAQLKTPLSNLTDKMPVTSYIKHTNLDNLFSQIMYTGGFDNHVVTCATPNKGVYGSYMDPYCTFIENHAYSIKNIDLYKRQVEIVNPHNTKLSYTLPFQEFQQYFTEVCDLKL